MRSALILAVASTVAAQYFPGQPACATSCLASAISKVGCPASDISCQCGPSQASIGIAAAGCLLGNCNLSEVNQAQSAGNAVCSSFNAGLLSGIPASTSAGASSGTGSGTMSMTAAPSSAASSSGAAAATTTTTTTGSGSSGASGSGSSSGSTTGAASSSGSSSGNGSTTSTGTAVTTGSNGLPTTVVSTTTRPNAGATPGPALGAGILAGVIGAVAAL